MEYIQQDAPLGIAHAVKIARDYMGETPFVLYLGDNFLLGGVKSFVDSFRENGANCQILLHPVNNPQAFGIAEFVEGRVTRIVEKPTSPPSNLAVIGIYMFDHHVFEAVERIKPSARGELEITDTIQYFIDQLHEATGGDAVVVAGVGQHQMWVSQFWQFTEPRSWINSGGLGTMGFAVPAAIGAKMARPNDLVFALDGDGCFQMTCQELITAATEHIPIKIAVFNNHGHGMVRQWQRLFYGGRFSATDLGTVAPDYPALAEAMGCAGLRAEKPSEVGPVIDKALAINDRPVVIEVVVDPDEMCFPMVKAGGSCDNVAMGPEDL